MRVNESIDLNIIDDISLKSKFSDVIKKYADKSIRSFFYIDRSKFNDKMRINIIRWH